MCGRVSGNSMFTRHAGRSGRFGSGAVARLFVTLAPEVLRHIDPADAHRHRLLLRDFGNPHVRPVR